MSEASVEVKPAPESAMVVYMEQLPRNAEVRAESPLAGELAGDVASADGNAAVRLEELALATHLVLRGDAGDAQFREGVEAALGLPLPQRLQSSTEGDRCLRWISPDEWLLTADYGDAFKLETMLHEQLSGHVSIVNVSGGQTLFRLSGAAAQTVLRKSTAYDVHDRNFPVGKVVTTVIAKSQGVVCRVANDEWEIVVRRSFARYLWRWLQDAGREFL